MILYLAVEEGLYEFGVVLDGLDGGGVAEDLVDEGGRDAAPLRLSNQQLQDRLDVKASCLQKKVMLCLSKSSVIVHPGYVDYRRGL